MDIENELTNATILNSLKENNLWEVPNDYFESFADKFMQRLETEEMNPETVFSDIPENYFANFSGNILDSIENEELKINAPVLFSLPKKIHYKDIPENYFAEVSTHIQAKVQEKTQISNRENVFFAKKYMKTWASIAAMCVMVIGAAFLFNHLNTPKQTSQELSFSQISNAELAVAAEVVDEFDVNTLVEELQLNSSETADFEELSDEELSDYVKDIDISDIQ